MYDAQVVLAKGTVAFGFGLHWSWQGSVCQQKTPRFWGAGLARTLEATMYGPSWRG